MQLDIDRLIAYFGGVNALAEALKQQDPEHRAGGSLLFFFVWLIRCGPWRCGVVGGEGVDGLECGADVDHQVFGSLWQFVIGDLILFYCDGDGQGAAGVRVPHTGSAPPIVSRDDQVGVPV